jgi:hypothetical protein
MNKTPAIIVTAVVLFVVGVMGVASISDQRIVARVTAERVQQEARQRQNDWQEHLKRAIYNHAHPEILAAWKRPPRFEPLAAAEI